jgi:lysophospholipase L1-like esterase
MTEYNPDIYFIEKILKHQQGKETVVVLNGANQTLLKQYVDKPGYQANMKAIDSYFHQKHVKYLNLEGKIADSLFTDHTHFIAEGYKTMAALLWSYYAN